MRKVVSYQLSAIRLVIIFLFLLLATPTFAAETCQYPQNCNFAGNDPSSGQQECTGSPNPETGICVWDPGIDPNCSECKQINPLPSSSPTPTLTISPTISVTPTGTSLEEQAIYNLNQGLLPPDLAKEKAPENPDILKQFFNVAGQLLGGIFGNLFFATKFTDPPKMYVQSDSINQANIPQELQPTGTEINKNIQDYLGGSAGFYGAGLPKEIQGDIQQSEKSFEKANFPAGINPITGQK